MIMTIRTSWPAARFSSTAMILPLSDRRMRRAPVLCLLEDKGEAFEVLMLVKKEATTSIDFEFL